MSQYTRVLRWTDPPVSTLHCVAGCGGRMAEIVPPDGDDNYRCAACGYQASVTVVWLLPRISHLYRQHDADGVTRTYEERLV